MRLPIAAVCEIVPIFSISNLGARLCALLDIPATAGESRGAHSCLSSGGSLTALLPFRVNVRGCPMTTLKRFAGLLGFLSALTVCFFLECMEQLAQIVSTDH